MKVLMINGSPHEFGCTYTALSEVASSLKANSIESDIVYLGIKPVAGCTACGNCSKTGKCIFDDKINEVTENIDDYGAVVLGSPVYYAGASGQVCSFADRFFYVNASKMAGKIGAAVVSCRRCGASSALDRLNKYFTICNMTVASSMYWNEVHGSTAEDVKKDLEGMQTMRTLGQNIAHLMKSAEAALQNGLKNPQYEKKIKTNFIR